MLRFQSSIALLVVGAASVFSVSLAAQGGVGGDDSGGAAGGKFDQPDKFRQLEEILPTPNMFRTASGAPGPLYWQQRANYAIEVELDDENQRIIGSERITYFNHSPDTLRYIWLQLDNNIFAPDSDSVLATVAPNLENMPFDRMYSLLARRDFDGSVRIKSVRDDNSRDLPFTIVKTMMRIDLPQPLEASGSVSVNIGWHYEINNKETVWGRTACEYFEDDDNYIYEIAHWFPRMAAYTDATGWQHKQFLGRGEFTLELGDYDVRITAPDDHVVAATGVLQNPGEVLTAAQRNRLAQARAAETPMFIISPEEAIANESSRASGKKTWHFKAENVRDFAFASSRKFIWDAQGQDVGDRTVLAMSYYPNEGEPLWSKYSTHAIMHTLDVYGKHTFAYPYPVAISVNGPVGGMEYPMICFNGPRPEEDGTYSARSKYGLISVVIHEVGHNWFPMIVNSDERQWTWMDEGLNTFLQYLAEQEWEEDYPSRRGEPQNITEYMMSVDQVPIMTNSESLHQFGSNAYGKPATALNVLRETILGRKLFDFAFKEYANRWRFKRPMPADLFRTIEDASGIDLDWFWRGWFYTTDHVDISLDRVRQFTLDSRDPSIDKASDRAERDADPITLSQERNHALTKRTDRFGELEDFYNKFDELDITPQDITTYQEFLEKLDEKDLKLLQSGINFYILDFSNHGGLVTPIILEIEYTDGETELMRIPAEIWRYDAQHVSKLILTETEIEHITIDPRLETADVNLDNNRWPPKPVKSRFQLFKDGKKKNPMQKARENGDDS